MHTKHISVPKIRSRHDLRNFHQSRKFYQESERASNCTDFESTNKRAPILTLSKNFKRPFGTPFKNVTCFSRYAVASYYYLTLMETSLPKKNFRRTKKTTETCFVEQLLLTWIITGLRKIKQPNVTECDSADIWSRDLTNLTSPRRQSSNWN